MKHPLLIAILLLLPWGAQGATTRYVTDQFEITMRSGASTGHKIIKMLPSGTAVDVLGSNSQNGYSEVRTSDGKTGYVLSHQLMESPSARDLVASLEQQLKELQGAPDQLGAKFATLQERDHQLNEANQQLQGAKNDLERELEAVKRTSANALRIADERNQLRQGVAELTRQVENLKQQNRDLANDSTQRWFLIGAGVVLLGIILGLILPHLRFQRRKSSWGSL